MGRRDESIGNVTQAEIINISYRVWHDIFIDLETPISSVCVSITSATEYARSANTPFEWHDSENMKLPTNSIQNVIPQFGNN